LIQTNFEPPRLETKHLVLFPKIENIFSYPQTPKILPCIPNPKPSKWPHSKKNPKTFIAYFN
jgi:hypothetical protein